jgi:hypothetical protein
MPSSGVSDGVQSLITTKFPGTIFCAVETSGDGATNFYSRVQMYMFKARQVAEAELQRALDDSGLTKEQVRSFLDANPEFTSPLHHAPHTVASQAANLVYEVADLIKLTPAQRAQKKAKQTVAAVTEAAVAAPGKAKSLYAFLTNPETHAQLREDATLIRDIVKGKTKERFAPLVSKLAGKAYFENNDEVAHVNADHGHSHSHGGVNVGGAPAAAELDSQLDLLVSQPSTKARTARFGPFVYLGSVTTHAASPGARRHEARLARPARSSARAHHPAPPPSSRGGVVPSGVRAPLARARSRRPRPRCERDPPRATHGPAWRGHAGRRCARTRRRRAERGRLLRP